MKTIEEIKKAACIRSQKWAENNRERVRERSRLRRQNPDVREYLRQYRSKHKERAAAYNKQWRAENPEKVVGYTKRYGERHREKHGVSSTTRWARKKFLPVPLRPCPATCELCDRVLESGKAHLDHCHATGIFRGWLCNRCNLALGHLGDSIKGLKRALAYLERAYVG